MLDSSEKINCSKCKTPKDKKEFRTRNNRKSGRSSWCKTCLNIWRDGDKIKNPSKWADTQRSRDLYKNYKLTPAEYNQMLDKQNGLCACCGRVASLFKRNPHVDHNHKTGQVRGILCTQCNPGLGYFEDSIERLEMAITYLRKFEK